MKIVRKEVKRGDIYYARLDPVVGSEQGGVRPVLIISNDIGNRFSPTVIVAAITSKKVGRIFPTHVCFNHIRGLPQPSVVLLEQIRTIDKQRLKEKIAFLGEQYMKQINTPLLVSIGVPNTENNIERRHTDV